MAPAFSRFTQPAAVTVQSEHFNSLSALSCFFFFFVLVPTDWGLPPPPFVLCKFTQGLLDMLDAMGKKRNKRGGRKRNLFNKVGRAVLKAAANKGRAKLKKKEDFIQFCAPITLKLLFLYAGKSSAMVNNHTVICVFTKTVVIPLQ